MKRLFHISLIFVALLTFGSTISQAQCKGFARKVCKNELGDFIHDGNYHAAVLSEGEEAELFKTFYSDQEYRVAVCGSDNLPNVEFKIVDVNRNVLYTNRDHDFKRTWDFRLESSQQLKLIIKVHATGDEAETPASGCVAIMFGFKVK